MQRRPARRARVVDLLQLLGHAVDHLAEQAGAGAVKAADKDEAGGVPIGGGDGGGGRGDGVGLLPVRGV